MPSTLLLGNILFGLVIAIIVLCAVVVFLDHLWLKKDERQWATLGLFGPIVRGDDKDYFVKITEFRNGI